MSNETTPLIEAIEKNNIDEVRRLIEAGAGVNTTYEFETAYGTSDNPSWCTEVQTALMLAAYKSEKEIVELLVEHGADVNSTNSYGITALMLASNAFSKTQTQIVEYLIEHGADINAVNKIGESALFYATTVETAKVLIDHGADINIVNEEGISILQSANTHSIEIAAMLIEYGVEPKSLDIQWWLIWAIQNKRKKVVEIMINNKADINAVSDGSTPLMWAVSDNSLDIVKLLIDKGADINTETDFLGFKQSALEISVTHNFTDIVKLLLEHGADVKFRDYKGKSLLSYAKEDGYDKEIVELLIKYGA